MNEFIEIKANPRSYRHRKLVHGVGINDADYLVYGKGINGKRTRCPFYAVWLDMIKRAYSKSHNEKNKTYTECTVDSQWIRFSVFKGWMEKQDWNGKFLDKDILIYGNKVYSKDTCMFVSKEVNNIILSRDAKRGRYPKGVALCKDTGRFKASLSIRGKSAHIGRFDTSEEAEKAYNIRKARYIKEAAEYQEPKIKNALLRHADRIMAIA